MCVLGFGFGVGSIEGLPDGFGGAMMAGSVGLAESVGVPAAVVVGSVATRGAAFRVEVGALELVDGLTVTTVVLVLVTVAGAVVPVEPEGT